MYFNGVYYEDNEHANQAKLELVRTALNDTQIVREIMIYLNSDIMADILDSVLDFYGIEEE